MLKFMTLRTMLYYQFEIFIFGMSELSKFINLLIQFSQKVEGHLNKKYKPFIKKVINLDNLAKNVSPNRIKLTKELIVFKLGLQSKSHRAVQISLHYLLKMFEGKYIDVNLPNYCEMYVIEESGVKELEGVKPEGEVRNVLISLMRHCLHYKKGEINQLVIKVLQGLITQPILDLILDAATEYPQSNANGLLYNFFNFRFHIFEDICYYTQSEIKTFHVLTLPSERIDSQIKRALQTNSTLQNLVGKYMIEYLSIIDGLGGRYGLCVICGEPAQHYCKITKASLCGLDCKKKHIDMAERQYKQQFQATHLWQSIMVSMEELLVFLQNHQNSQIFTVLSSLLQKPFLFMMVKLPFRQLIGKHSSTVLSKLLKYRNDQCFESIYIFMSSLTKYWLYECLAPVQYFFREYIIKILQDKKPSLRFLNLVFKALAKILQNGKVAVQLYINFDCEVNKENILEKVLFQVTKMVQDKFVQVPFFNKSQKNSIKNHCLSLFIIMTLGLNGYRKHEAKSTSIQSIIQLKQKKMSLEQFVIRFNEHWTSGLKTLFNLNLVGLDSNEEIVDIFLNLRGLSKDNIEEYFSCEKGDELFKIFLKKLISKNKDFLLLTLVDLFHYIPLKTSSICLKKFQEYFRHNFESHMERELQVYVGFLCGSYNVDDFKNFIKKRPELQGMPIAAHTLYLMSAETKTSTTVGSHKAFFTYCCSRDYLQVLSNQLSLLQIPISYMLENDYEIDRLLGLIQELVQICPHSNWLPLLVKYSALQRYPSQEFDQQKFKIVMGVLNIMEKQAEYIEKWSNILAFISQLNSIFRLLEHKKIVEGRVALSERLNMGIVERCLMQAGSKCNVHFDQLMLAVICTGRDEIDSEVLFMTQKFFELVDNNPKKFLLIVRDFMPFLINFTKQLDTTSTQVCISVADMLKQSFAKLLRLPKSSDQWINHAQDQFWQLFLNISRNKNKEVSDFVVNCVTMTILHYYNIGYKSWRAVFVFMKGHVKEYRQQVYTIIEKILGERMRNCQQFYPVLIELCLDLLHQEERKISTEALHSLQTVLQITNAITINSEEPVSQSSQFKQLGRKLVGVQERLINCIFYNCHEEIMDTFFRLLNFTVKAEHALDKDQIDQLMQGLFSRIQEYTPQTLQISQKTINFALTWSTQHRYSLIIELYQTLILDKYSLLSLSAIKCIKTYIQMLNPKNRQEWLHIEKGLLSIARNTHIGNEVDLGVEDRFLGYRQGVEFEDVDVRVNVGLFGNKMVIQKSIVELLPNHLECLEEVTELYREVMVFNDNVFLRCLLWRKGLGGKNTQSPPDLLALQEVIAGKLVAIYNSTKRDQIIAFSLGVFQKYCSVSTQLNEVQSYLGEYDHNDNQVESATLLKEYLTARKIPLMRVMGYFLPKYLKYCQTSGQKKQITLRLTQCLKYVENRQPFIKTIRDLTKP